MIVQKGNQPRNCWNFLEKFNIHVDEYKNYIELLHDEIGAVYSKNRLWNREDEEILSAIRYHTMGRENMSLLEKIIFIADYIEPGGNFQALKK